MSLQSKQGLWAKLASKKYRDAFVASRIAQTIAFQARLLRQRKDLSQADLAKELGTSQNAISRLENPKYGKPSISTLRKIAAFFDVGLVVRFAPLSEIVDWTTNLSAMAVDVPGFEHDTGFVDRKPPASEAMEFDGAEVVSQMFAGATNLADIVASQQGQVASALAVSRRRSNVIPFPASPELVLGSTPQGGVSYARS
jgi:transcriptional regulator with XRE-family HTH domain